MAEQIFEACEKNLDQVLAFVCGQLENWNCSMKVQTQLEIAVEELFINIASYAYSQKADETASSPKIAKIQIELLPDRVAEITFYDFGIPYNPLKRPDPDTTKPAEERDIGGLGVFLVKKTMDEVQYRYENDQNILTIRKKM